MKVLLCKSCGHTVGTTIGRPNVANLNKRTSNARPYKYYPYTMIIDFHTHVYPDAMAERIVAALADVPGGEAHTDGTINGLLKSMNDSGVDKSVILPVCTRKGQFDTVNRFAAEINGKYDSLISFGGIHPDDDAPEEKLTFLKESGFKGIKIHPDYTETFIDDERYIRIVTAAQELGLIVVTHAGKDPAYDTIHCPPERARCLLDHIDDLTSFEKPFIVFAHLGGNRLLADVEKYLVGQNCYIDISCSFADLGDFSDSSDNDIVRVIKSHGADKILFATDSPWNSQKAYIERFMSLDLTDKEKDMILCKNALDMLGIE